MCWVRREAGCGRPEGLGVVSEALGAMKNPWNVNTSLRVKGFGEQQLVAGRKWCHRYRYMMLDR